MFKSMQQAYAPVAHLVDHPPVLDFLHIGFLRHAPPGEEIKSLGQQHKTSLRSGLSPKDDKDCHAWRHV